MHEFQHVFGSELIFLLTVLSSIVHTAHIILLFICAAGSSCYKPEQLMNHVSTYSTIQIFCTPFSYTMNHQEFSESLNCFNTIY